MTLWLHIRAHAPGSSVLTHEYLLDISKAPSPPSFQIPACSPYIDRAPLPPSNFLLCYYLHSSLLPSPPLILWSCPVSSLHFFPLLWAIPGVSGYLFSLIYNESLHPNNGADLLAVSLLHPLICSHYIKKININNWGSLMFQSL